MASEKKRKNQLPHDTILRVLLQYKDSIILEDGNIVSQKDPIWVEVTQEINHEPWMEKVEKKNAYSYLVSNTCQVREKLCSGFGKESNHVNPEQDENLTNSLLGNSTLDSSYNYDLEVVIRITCKMYATFWTEELDPSGKYRKKRRTQTIVHLNESVFKKFIERELEKIQPRRSCSYDFKCRAYNKTSGTARIVGKCQCHSRIECFIRKDGETIVLRCELEEDKEKRSCGKREIKKSAAGNGQTTKVVSQSASEDKATETTEESRLFIDSDPIRAMEILRVTAMAADITTIRRFPIGVEYCTPHQKTLYRSLIAEEGYLTLIMDSSIIQPLKRMNKISSELTLHQAVISTSIHQVPVGQFITEVNESYLLHNWLITWIEGLKLIPPKKILVQGMTEVVTACIQAFTDCQSVVQYVNMLHQNECIQSCTISIDAFGLLKKYAAMMRHENREVANFYLNGIAQLMHSKALTTVELIIRALFAVAHSANRADFGGENLSTSDYYREKLGGMEGDVSTLFNVEIDKLYEFSEEELSLIEKLKITVEQEGNHWYDWAMNLQKEAFDDIKEGAGEIASRWYMPHVADELLQDLKVFPLWGQSMGTGAHSYSIARVEMEMEKMKQHLKAAHQLPLRVDIFLQAHKKYVDGSSRTNVQHDFNSSSGSRDSENESYELFESNTSGKSCHVCKEDLLLSTAVCIMCSMKIHPVSPCSVPIGLAGTASGVDRMCHSCSIKRSGERIIESNAFDNWMNEDVVHARKNDETNRVKSVPVLLKGNHRKLSKYNDNGEIIGISMACAFDSLCQLLLCAAFVAPSFQNIIEKKQNENSFIKLIHDTLSFNVTNLTFGQRFELLKELFGYTLDETVPLKKKSINCVSMVDEICGRLLCDMPSFHVRSWCRNHGLKNEETRVLLRLPLSLFVEGNSDWSRVENEICPLIGHVRCQTDTCITQVSYEVNNDFIILETLGGSSNVITLSQIPVNIKLSMMNEEFHLRGFINFDPPIEQRELRGRTRKNEKREEAIGHYTAFCLNLDGCWIRYDTTTSRCDPNHDVLPHLLLYTK